jgi:hypothetical protein
MREGGGLPDDRPAHGHPLSLPTRQVLRLLRQQLVGESEDPGGVADPTVDLAPGDLPHPQTERHVLVHGHVRIQRVVLEDHGDVSVHRRHVVDHAIPDPDRALGHLLEAGDHQQDRGLAASGGADEDHQAAVGHLEIQRRDRPRSIRVGLGHVLE